MKMKSFLANLFYNFKKDWYKLPNLLTLSRMPLAVLSFVLLLDGFWASAMLVFGFAAVTDMLDGRIARRYGLVTDFGKIIDPIVDKFFIILIMIGISIVRPYTIPFSIVLTCREIYVAKLLYNTSKKSEVLFSGKIKTFYQSLMYFVAFIPIDILNNTTILSVLFGTVIASSLGVSYYLYLNYGKTMIWISGSKRYSKLWIVTFFLLFAFFLASYLTYRNLSLVYNLLTIVIIWSIASAIDYKMTYSPKK